MDPQNKCAIYIGLGGTGVKSLLKLKKRFIDAYGEMPKSVGLLAIDTDANELNSEIVSADGRMIRLDDSERVLAVCSNGNTISELYSDAIARSVGELLAADEAITDYRSTPVSRKMGHFMFKINKSRISSAISSKVTSVIAYGGYLTEVNMVFSVAGSTGSGMFIDVAYLLTEIYSSHTPVAHVITPGVFKTMPSSSHVDVNGSASLLELDYLMSLNIGDDPVVLNYMNGDKREISHQPFASVLVYDNISSIGAVCHDIDHMVDIVVSSLMLHAFRLHNKYENARITDTYSCLSTMGNYNIVNKRAWAVAVGLCDIVYQGELLSNLYQHKAAIEIIGNMTRCKDDASLIANTWIDSYNVRLRGNNGCHHVAESILDTTYCRTLDVGDPKECASRVKAYIKDNTPSESEIDAKVDSIVKMVQGELQSLLMRQLYRSGGVELSYQVCNCILSQINQGVDEQQQVLDNLSDLEPKIKSSLDEAIVSYSSLGIFTLRSTRELCRCDLEQATKQYISTLLDIMRRKAAIRAYNRVIELLHGYIRRISTIFDSLSTVSDLCRSCVEEFMKQTSLHTYSQILYFGDLIENMCVSEEDGDDAMYMRTFADIIYAMPLMADVDPEQSVSAIKKSLLEHTRGLKGAQYYSVLSLDRMLVANNEVQSLISRASMMSRASYNFYGYMPQIECSQLVCLGVNEADAMIDNDHVRAMIPSQQDVIQVSTGQRDRVTVCSMSGPLPIYTIGISDNSFSRYRSIGSRVSEFHIDELYCRIQQEHFSLYPDVITYDDMPDVPED